MTTREHASPEGRVGKDMSILQVSFTRTLRERLSIRSEISSMGDWLGCGVTTSSLVLGCEGFAGFEGFFSLVTWACLGPVTLGADFSVLLFLLMFVTSLRVGI